MTRILFCFIAISFTTLLHAQEPLSKSQQDVQETVMQMFNALSNRDSVSLKNLCTADVKFYEYGEVWTIDTLINKAITKNTAADFKRTNKLGFINTTVNGNAAWTTYNLYSEIIINGKNLSRHWMETTVLIRTGRKWKIQLLHSTLINRT